MKKPKSERCPLGSMVRLLRLKKLSKSAPYERADSQLIGDKEPPVSVPGRPDSTARIYRENGRKIIARLRPAMQDYKSQKWLAAYEAVLTEADVTKLAARVLDAEYAIFARIQSISLSDYDLEERADIVSAISYLRTLQTEKLGFPKFTN